MPTPSFDRMPLRSDQPSVGAVLRHRREELEWQIEDVAQWLRIRARLLVALEADDFASLPGEAYAVGFVRAYAQAMQLDAADLVARFQRDYRRVAGTKTELVFPQAQGERGLPVGLLIGAGFVLVAMAYAGWYHFSSHDEPIAKQVPSLAALMPNSPHSVMTSPQVASVMPGQAPAEEKQMLAAVPPAQGAQPAPVAVPPVNEASPAMHESNAPTAVQAAPIPEKPEEAPSSESVSSENTAPETLTPDQEKTDIKAPLAAVNTVSEGQIAVHAIAPVWVQVTDHTGHVLVSRVLPQGETWVGDAAGSPYRVSVGNAGGVVFMTHDVVSAPLGRNGAVRRNISVTTDAVQQGAFGHGALPVAAPEDSGGDKALPVEAEPASHGPTTVKTSHTAPLVKKAPVHEPRQDVTTDELNARQLTGQSPSGDASLGH
ncbi:helix-turn-helix domain-containing protein [Neokomagataea anthophila]|uniref:Helix-turn-helix domain-containing protein n=1 Tax=Neokomagataea anthophila TaxID=2826925 RepID=A0ABS5E6P0_9PROT|nr:helix-turn-helix domain-containing protein [Neokomagataea anthophila]MBR0559578.1 helix-turn-helix domain-containing protein [Neokomagataea anthophila]